MSDDFKLPPESVRPPRVRQSASPPRPHHFELGQMGVDPGERVTPPRPRGIPGIAWLWLIAGHCFAAWAVVLVLARRTGFEWWVTWAIMAFAAFSLRSGQRLR